MNLWIDAVTDRTQTDVNYVKTQISKGYANFSDDEKTEWLAGLKGAINTSDLERIQNNISILNDVLELGLTILDVADMPQKDLYQNIMENTATIREKAPIIHSTTPEAPAMPLNTYSKWNNIEQILLDIYVILHNNFYHYAGEAYYAGDEIGLLL